MSEDLHFILIDDESLSLNALEHIITRFFPKQPIHKAMDGKEGWAIIKKHGANSVILCDVFMPIMNGLDVLEKTKAEKGLSQAYFVIITSSNEQEVRLKALKLGADDLIHKPFVIDDLIARLRVAVRVLNLQNEVQEANQELRDLQQNFDEEILKFGDIFTAVLKARMPKQMEKAEKIASAAVWIANQFQDTKPSDIRDIERAAKLCYLGQLGLPSELMDKPVLKDGFIANPKFEVIAEFPKEHLSKIKGYEKVSEILTHIYENNDGSGFPDKLKMWKIPLGSRIIRVVRTFYELLLSYNENEAKAMEEIAGELRRLYDHHVFAYLDQYLALHEVRKGKPEIPLDIYDLREKDILSRNIITASGLILSARGTQLTDDQINKIISVSKKDGVIGKVYIYERKEKEGVSK